MVVSYSELASFRLLPCMSVHKNVYSGVFLCDKWTIFLEHFVQCVEYYVSNAYVSVFAAGNISVGVKIRF